VPWLRWSVTGLSLWRPSFDPEPVHMRFVVDKVALGQDFFEYFHYSSSSTIPPMLHTHLCLHAAFTRTNGCSLRTSKKQRSFRNQEQWIDKYFNFLVINSNNPTYLHTTLQQLRVGKNGSFHKHKLCWIEVIS
jgi:hypothetical protein